MKYYKNDLLKAIFAGIIITIASLVYLSMDNKIIGSILFNIALITIVTYELNLFTGKIGYLLQENYKYSIKILIIILGNLIGTITTSYLALQTRYANKFIQKATYLTDIKLSDDAISILILSIFCGILMYIGVHGYKHIKHEVGKYIVIILCVCTFILAGFEHSIANSVYITLSGSWSLFAIYYFVIMLIGNSIGAIAIASIHKAFEK